MVQCFIILSLDILQYQNLVYLTMQVLFFRPNKLVYSRIDIPLLFYIHVLLPFYYFQMSAHLIVFFTARQIFQYMLNASIEQNLNSYKENLKNIYMNQPKKVIMIVNAKYVSPLIQQSTTTGRETSKNRFLFL